MANVGAMTGSSLPDSGSRFMHFPDIPPEIRARIWHYAIPDPRTVETALVMIINLDLSRPRAFLPRAHELRACQEDDSDDAIHLYDDEEYGDPTFDFSSRQLVFDVLHTCREARKVALEIYSLDLESKIPKENFEFWKNDDDIVYFQCTENSIHMAAMLHYVMSNRKRCLRGFQNIKHVAFLLNRLFLSAVDRGWSDDFDEEEENSEELDNEEAEADNEETMDTSVKHNLLKNFPGIESLSLFLDPSGFHDHWRTGKIALYTPETDKIIPPMGCNSEDAELQIQQLLTARSDNVEPPIVDIYVAFRRRHKRKMRYD